MKTRIFAYKGYLAATNDLQNGNFITVTDSFVIVDSANVKITKEAKEILKKAEKVKDILDSTILMGFLKTPEVLIGIPEVFLQKSVKSTVSLPNKDKMFFGKDFTVFEQDVLEVLEDFKEVDFELDPGFTSAVDKYINEGVLT